MVTASNLTNEQIEALRFESIGQTIAPHINALCDLALASTEEARMVIALKPVRQRIARRLIADAINARAKATKRPTARPRII